MGKKEMVGIRFSVILLVILIIGMFFVSFQLNQKNNELQQCQKQNPVSCVNLEDVISDSCLIGCIYSTQFYYNNPNLDFNETSFGCLKECLNEGKRIKIGICGE